MNRQQQHPEQQTQHQGRKTMSRRNMLVALGVAGAAIGLGATGVSGSAVMEQMKGNNKKLTSTDGGAVASVDELRQAKPVFAGQTLYLVGYTADAPGRGDGYVVAVQGTYTDNGGTVFQSGNAGWYWKRVHTDLVVEHFGVVPGHDLSVGAHNTARLTEAFHVTDYTVRATPEQTYVYNGDVIVAAPLFDGRSAVFKGITGCIRIAYPGCVVQGAVLDDGVRTDQRRSMLIEADHVHVTQCSFLGSRNQESCLEITGHHATVSHSTLRDASYMILGTTGSGTHITGNFFTGGNAKAVLNESKTVATTVPWGDAIKLSSDTNDLANPQAAGRHDNIITDNIFDDVYRDCVDLFTDGSRTIFSNNVIRNHHWNILDIKCIYRDDPSNGTSIDPTRREETIIATGNIIKDVDNPYASGEALFSVVHYKNQQIGGKVTDYTLGPRKVHIYGNSIDGAFGYVLRVLDGFDVSYCDNEHYNLINNAVYITGESGNRHVDVDRNKFYYKNGKDYWGTPIQAIRRTSANCTSGSVSGNKLVCDKADGVRGAVAIVMMGNRMAANNNTVEGFGIAVDASRCTYLACTGTRAHDCTIAVRIGQYGATTGARVTGTYATSCEQVVAVHQANTDQLILTDNSGIGISGVPYGDVTAIANKIVRNNDVI